MNIYLCSVIQCRQSVWLLARFAILTFRIFEVDCCGKHPCQAQVTDFPHTEPNLQKKLYKSQQSPSSQLYPYIRLWSFQKHPESEMHVVHLVTQLGDLTKRTGTIKKERQNIGIFTCVWCPGLPSCPATENALYFGPKLSIKNGSLYLQGVVHEYPEPKKLWDPVFGLKFATTWRGQFGVVLFLPEKWNMSTVFGSRKLKISRAKECTHVKSIVASLSTSR